MHGLTKPCAKFYSRQQEQKRLFGLLKVDGDDNIKVYLIQTP